MVKILFYTIDGLGLGHIVRSINVACEIRNLIDCKISFITNSPFLEIFKRYDFEVFQTEPVFMQKREKRQEDYSGIAVESTAGNEDFVITLAEKLNPDLFISDLQVVPMLKLSAYLKEKAIFSVYIFREVGNFGYLLNMKKYLEN